MIEQSLFTDSATADSTAYNSIASESAPPRPARSRRQHVEDSVRRCRADAMLFAEGAPANQILLLETGSVILFKLLPDGRRHILDIAGPGAMIGMASGAAYTLGARTLTTVTFCVVSRQTAEQSPELQSAIYRQALERLEAMQDHALRLGCMTAVERVANLLLRLADAQRLSMDPSGPFKLGLTLVEMGDHLGLATETVCRLLTTLKKNGLVASCGRDSFRILDQHEFSRMATAGNSSVGL